jgi:hypothetical protein
MKTHEPAPLRSHPRELADMTLPAAAKYLYVELCSFYGKSATVCPGEDLLAQRLNTSTSQVKRLTKMLVDASLVIVHREQTGQYRFNMYELPLMKLAVAAQAKWRKKARAQDGLSLGSDHSPNVPRPQPRVGQEVGTTEVSKEEHTPTPACVPVQILEQQKPAPEPVFEKIWALWIKQQRQKPALAAWNALRPTPELAATILAAAQLQTKRYRTKWRAEKCRYAPQLADWLVEERWTDIVPPSLDLGEPGLRILR